MADGVFNVALGKIAYYANLPAANDALLVVLLKSTGLQADATLRDYDDLATLLAASNDEATFTNYARKSITAGITVTVDDTNERVDVDIPDQTWTAAGGVSNDTLGKLLICYQPVVGGPDSAVLPLTFHDFTATTDGSDLTAVIATSGFFRASGT